MNKENKYKYIILAVVVVAAVLIIPTHTAHAADWWPDWIDNPAAFALSIFSYFVNIVFDLAGWFLTLTGGLLNISINLSMHIKEYVANTTGVYLVWQTIRDLSGMGIIFILLYTSFKHILGMDQGVGKLVKDIVIAGILINFSFFFTGLMIDASNIVSLAVYNAIVPQGMCNAANGAVAGATNYVDCAAKGFTDPKSYDGGLSAILTQSLKVTSIMNPKLAGLSNTQNNDATTNQLKILFMQTVGIIILVTTALSFVIASAAFVVRLVILIFLLAFSPIWFASWMLPGLDDLSGKFTKNLKTQLLFMPAYLIMLYAALKIVVGMQNVLGNVNNTGSNSVSGAIVMIVNYAFVVIMLNVPLMVAVSLGGVSDKWLKKVGAQNVWSNVGKWTGNRLKDTGVMVGRNTIGRGAAAFSESKWMRAQIANGSPLVSKMLYTGLSKTSSAGFGGGKNAGFSQVRKKKIETYKKMADSAEYTDEEKKRRAVEASMMPEVVFNQDKIKDLQDGPMADLRNKKKFLNQEMGDLARKLKTTSNIDEQKAIAAQIEANKELSKGVNEELGEHQGKVDAYNKEIGEFMKNSQTRKPGMAARWSKRGAFGRKVAKEITKEKKPVDEIIDALKGELGKGKDEGGKKEEKKP